MTAQATFTSLVGALIFYPWQIVGLWRSINRHIEETNKCFWANMVRVLVVFSFLGVIVNLTSYWPMYKGVYKMAFEKDEYADYIVNLNDTGTLIHLKGGLGFGVSKEVEQLIEKHPYVGGIILDSPGGRLYEGRELSKIITINALDTYSLKGCYSACATAFISGNKRFLAKGANLAFHQYRAALEFGALYVDLSNEQNKDLDIYKRQGINSEFLDKIFQARNEDFWKPTTEVLMRNGVVHKIVNPADLELTFPSMFTPQR